MEGGEEWWIRGEYDRMREGKKRSEGKAGKLRGGEGGWGGVVDKRGR